MGKVLDGDGRRQNPHGPIKPSKYVRNAAGNMAGNVQLDIECARDTVACINAVIANGDAIMLSRTASSGILAITVYSQGCDAARFYAKDMDEAQVILSDIENAAHE